MAQLVKHLSSAQVMISGSWDQAPCHVPLGSLLLALSLKSLSLSFFFFFKVLFIYLAEHQHRERQGEGEADILLNREPDVGLYPRTLRS